MKHGGDPEATAPGDARTDWLDLSTGINPRPYPVPPFPVSAWTALPTARALDALIEAARVAYRVPRDVELVAAPGTQSLIQWLPRLLPAGPVAVVSPTYGEHAAAFARAGADVIESSPDDPLPDNARHLVLVRPNNPDGFVLPEARLRALAGEVASRGGTIAVDEAFIDPTPEASVAALCATGPVVVLRSFGKFYGLAGLRLGMLLAAPPFAARVREALGPWAVSGPALAIGAAALADERWAASTRARLRADASALDACVARAGLELRGGTALFRLVAHPAARALHAALARRGVWVRRFEWDDTLLRFGLPGDATALARLDAALAGAVAEIAHAAGSQGSASSRPSTFTEAARTP